MSKCKKCGKNHDEAFHLKPSIKEKGYPTASKSYKAAHEKASAAEKRKYPRGYDKLKGMDIRAGRKHELLAKSTPTGEIEISKKVPPKLRKEVAFHEKVESKEIKKNKGR